jgi:hypothetical protein
MKNEIIYIKIAAEFTDSGAEEAQCDTVKSVKFNTW